MIETILICDTETTGLSPSKSELIEVAVILYSVKHKSIMQAASTLFLCEENKAEHINGISPQLTKELMVSEGYMSEIIHKLYLQSEATIAHNAQFDRGFLETHFKFDFNLRPWICTKNDFDWPIELSRKRLMDVCEAMGVTYSGSHRALKDCLFIAECFSKIDDLQERLEVALKK